MLAHLQNKQNSLNDLLKQKNDTTTQYDTSRLALSSEYDDRIANAKASIEDKAMEQYNIVYNNVMAQKQQEYENQQAELARQEAIRQYNQNYALQQAQLENANNSSNNNDDNEFTDSSPAAELTKKALSAVVKSLSTVFGKKTKKQTDQKTYDKLYSDFSSIASSPVSFANDSILKKTQTDAAKRLNDAYNKGLLSDTDFNELADIINSLDYKKPNKFYQ